MRTLVFQLVVLLLIASISGRQAGVVSGQVIRLAAQRADLARRAGSDTLTGLPNRQLLLDRLEHALALARREDSAVAVLFLDCDGFKTVNDTYGHQAGDQVLVEVAHRLESTVRNADSIARIGGDEFVIVLAGRVAAPAVPAIVDGVCQRLVRVLTAPMSVPADTDTAVVVGASIGASWCQGGDCAADLLLAAADGAMYTAKQAGGGTWRAAGRIDTTAAADVFPADRTPPARLAGQPTSGGRRPRGGYASGHSTGSASDT